jgi:hypothetical protein
MRWRNSDHIPEHWRTLGLRMSPLTLSARRATTPGQALRNFMGGLAVCEIAVACRTIGLDPGMGIGLHDDVQGRQSLIWDVMEPLRPVLDRLAIEIVTSRTWTRGDFHELPAGEVRLRPNWPVLRNWEVERARSLVAEITRLLVRELQRSKVLAHVAERVAAVVAHYAVATPGSRKVTEIRVPTVLSHSLQIKSRHAEHGLTESMLGERSALRRQRKREAQARYQARRASD